MRRGARKLLIWPNTVLVLAVLANPLGLTQLKVFWVSQRTWSFQRPSLLMLKFFIRDMSVLKDPGPATGLAPGVAGRMEAVRTLREPPGVEPRRALGGACGGPA